MEKRFLIPDTDLSVYPIGLGCADIGLKADAVAPEKVFDTYLDLGGNLIDTAHVYSNWVPGERARSERIIGDWLKGSDNRNQIIEEEIETMEGLAMKYMNEPADPTLRCIRGDNFDYHVDHPELMAMPFFGNCAGYFHKYLVKGSDAVRDMYYDTEKNRKVAENVKKLTERYECSITQAVMGFFRFQPFTCIPLYGTSSPEHIMDACKTLDVPFSENDYEEVLDV